MASEDEIRTAAVVTARRVRNAVDRLEKLIAYQAPADFLSREVVIIAARCWDFVRLDYLDGDDLRRAFGLKSVSETLSPELRRRLAQLEDEDIGRDDPSPSTGHPDVRRPEAQRGDVPADPDDDDSRDHEAN